MKVADVGEFGLIELVAQTIHEFKPADSVPHGGAPSGPALPPPAVLVGIGDDTAAWWVESPLQLATTDTLVQDVHFSFTTATWREIGWKALAVNLSDIAAMGGLPRYALVTLGLTIDLEVEHVVDLYKGMMDVACRFGVALAGGDIVRARDIFLTVAMMGEALPLPGSRADILLRSRARPGDQLAVTGYLGSSAAGLLMLSRGRRLQDEAAASLREAHLRPVPRVREGMVVRREGGLAAMDISDGLLADLAKMCAASGVGASVSVDRLPIHPLVSAYFSSEAETLALSGGEDYELLFAAPADVITRVRAAVDVPVSVIGEVTADTASGVRVLDSRGRELQQRLRGWDHLRRE